MTLTNRIIFPLTCGRIFSQKRSCLFLIKFCLLAERCQISNFLPRVNQWHVSATATWRAVPYLYRKWQFRNLATLGNRRCPDHRIRLCLWFQYTCCWILSLRKYYTAPTWKTAVETKSMQLPTKVFFSCIH